MIKKSLLRPEVTAVKNGVAKEEVESFIKGRGTGENSWLEQADHLNKPKDLSEHMNGMVSVVTAALRKVQEDSAQSMLAEAKKDSDSAVSLAKVAAQSIMEEAEGVKSSTLAAQEAAQGIVVEAKERAKGIVMEAIEKALGIEEEAKKHAKEAYSESKEQAEALIAKGFERIQQLMENESESLLQSLGSLRKSPGQKKSRVDADQDDGATLTLEHSNEEAQIRASEDKEVESEPVKAQVSDSGSESSQRSRPKKDKTSDEARKGSIIKGGAKRDLQDSPVAAVSESSASNGHRRDIRETPQTAGEGTLYKGSVQILLPSDAHMLSLWSVQKALEGVQGVTIKERISSADETSIVVFAQSPVPLIDILRGLPDVSKVEEENEEEVAAGGFFGSRQNKGFGAGLAMRKLRLTFPIKSRE